MSLITFLIFAVLCSLPITYQAFHAVDYHLDGDANAFHLIGIGIVSAALFIVFPLAGAAAGKYVAAGIPFLFSTDSDEHVEPADTGNKAADGELRDKVTHDMHVIGEALESSPMAVVRAIFFAVGSVRITFGEFARDLNSDWLAFKENDGKLPRDENGDIRSNLFFGWMVDAVEEAYERREEIHGRIVQARAGGTERAARDLLQFFLDEVTGLGPAKGGFMCQFATGFLGCLDTQNIQRLDVDGDELELLAGRVNGAQDYRRMIRDLPETGPELWTNWVRLVGDRSEHVNGATVSEIHRSFIVNGYTYYAQA